MSYKKENIKKGVNVHKINTNKFKTNLFAIFLTTNLDRKTITQNALLASVLRRGTKNMTTQEEISKNLENMYGASFDCGVEKSGNNHIIKFFIESINNNFLPSQENLSKECMEILLDIVFSPYLENGKFKQEYVDGEKENLKQLIQGKIDNKARYAYDRCIEEMYKNEPYGLYKYGYIEDLDKITPESLYQYYTELIKNAKIDIFVSGELNDEIISEIKENEIVKKLPEREAKYSINSQDEQKTKIEKPNTVTESMQITQGKLIIGLDVLNASKENKYATSVYNVILGGSANSKMFQNVREKASLAYSAGSNYLRQKDNIIIKCGIDIPNYEKALEIIKEQLKQMENGDFTQEDIQNAKILISSTVGSIPETQDSEITYYLAQELSDEFVSISDYVSKIKEVTKEQIVQIAKNIQINTVYFLKD